MKYALFALGLLLLFIGAYSVYFGAGIIEVERGWSSVIAGTTAAVGGILIIAIAALIRSLEQIRALLQAPAVAAANTAPKMEPRAYDATPAGENGYNQEASSQNGYVLVADPAPAAVSWPPHTLPVQEPFAPLQATTPSGASPASQAAIVTVSAAVVESKLAEGIQEVPIAAKAMDTMRNPAVAPSGLEPSKSTVRDLWRRVARETETKFSSRPAMVKEAAPVEPPAPLQPPALPRVAEEPRQPELGTEHSDWLDHAFAELDASLAQTTSSHFSPPKFAEPAATEALGAATSESPMPEADASVLPAEPPEDEMPEPPPLAHEPLAHESLAHEPLTHGPLTHGPLAHEPAAAEKPAIIGRYDAEGTNYIMYADGSIEAHSERGVAHFKSMADLKAYFEAQGTPQ
jgi:hypothetical protein